MGVILTLASSVRAQVSAEGAPAPRSSTGHRMLLAGKPELLLLARNVEKLGRWWSSGLRCEAGGACVPEHVLEDAVTLVLRTGLKGHLSSHELPAVCPMLCSQASASCCLSVIPPEDQTCRFSGLCAAQR